MGLAIFGIIVGFVNLIDVDTTRFLVAGIALELSASAFRRFTFIGVAMSDVIIFVDGSNADAI